MPITHRWTPLLAALLLAVAYLAVTPGRASAAGALLSQGRPATASSTENATFPASNAVDGNAGTRWSSAFADPQWVQVDLGATATIDQVTLNWEAAFARSFQIQVALRHRPVHDDLLDHDRRRRRPDTGRRRHRPVRPDERHRAGNGVRLLAVGVPGLRYDGRGRVRTANAAQGRPATASSTENATFPASNAVDGNAATRWSSAFADPQWLQVDLGATATVCGVTLTWEAAFARSFQIQVAPAATGPVHHDLLDHDGGRRPRR